MIKNKKTSERITNLNQFYETGFYIVASTSNTNVEGLPTGNGVWFNPLKFMIVIETGLASGVQVLISRFAHVAVRGWDSGVFSEWNVLG